MRIGLINELHGRPGTENQPTWQSISSRAKAAEAVGFDLFVFEDALMYRGEEAVDGVWESMTVAAALAASTATIEVGQSVVNSVYRSPAMTASMAETLNEISGGRYILGIGAGNTPDSDYEGFGFPTDFRYSRFEEAIQIIHTLLKTGKVDFDGDFYAARNTELVLRGPGEQGPSINIAGGKEKMLKLVAKFGDAWNWWVWGESYAEASDRLVPLLDALNDALEAEGRPRDSIDKTIDYYTVIPEGFTDEVPNMENPLRGSSEEIAEGLLEFSRLGFTEVRCDVYPRSLAAIEGMEPVVELVHAG